jgi:hypothetical protein
MLQYTCLNPDAVKTMQLKCCCMLRQAFKHSVDHKAPGIIYKTLGNEVLLDALDNLETVRAQFLNNLRLPGAHVQGPQGCTLCKCQQAHGSFFFSMREIFNGPCDTCIALNIMQACTDFGYTHTPMETAAEGPSNCGDILSGFTILAAFYEPMLQQEPRPTNQRGVVKQSSLADSKYPLLGLHSHSQQCTLTR